MKKFVKFIENSFLNEEHEVDGKLITSCLSILVLLGSVLMYYLTGKALPEHMWLSFVGFVGIGFGFATWETVAKVRASVKSRFTNEPTPDED